MNAATGRSDYDASVKLATLRPEEPIFVLRAGDAVAADAVRGWASLAHAKGAPVEAIELALQQADRMDAWPLKKVPNGPDLEDHEAKQLRYQHSRRAWRSQTAPPPIGEVLAQQLGRDAVLGQLRPIVSDLTAAIEAGAAIDDAMTRLLALVGWAPLQSTTSRLNGVTP